MRGQDPIGSIAYISTRDHDLLTGLGDDDHTQYVLRSILTTDADLFTRSGGVITRLGIGSADQLLKVVGGVPAWATVGTPEVVVKPSSETVNDSTVLQNDDHLKLTVANNDMWLFFMCLRVLSATATPDIDIAWTVPTDGVIKVVDTLSGLAYFTVTDATSERLIPCASGPLYYYLWYYYRSAGTAGTVQLQWAQHVATAEDTQITGSSFLLGFKVRS